ncbi:MAG: hypothetical protein RIR12_1744 [Bacteroidota bacterium]|jgi:hypothetical protein
MKKIILPFLLLLTSIIQGQSIFGYWYGNANIKTQGSANNYLVELVLMPEKTHVKGLLNYYFKNTYRSLEVVGNYNAASRKLILNNIPVTYHGSISSMEVDCPMNFQAILRVSKNESSLTGAFSAPSDYKRMCPDIRFFLTLNADISKKDSILKEISNFKETYQVWTPGIEDTLVAIEVKKPEKAIINPITERDFAERKKEVQNEIEVSSDSLTISLYDNGEVDGDMISLFYNNKLILDNKKLTHKSLKLSIQIDKDLESNELSMFAENLGLIPPNTALLIIDDGKKQHQLRVSSNLEKSATIKIKRKK